MLVNGTHYRTIWLSGSTVKMINQRLLPHEFEIFESVSYMDTAAAISDMTVRGAGAIGAASGFALAQAALEAPLSGFMDYIREAFAIIRGTRPTAQNLFYSLGRVLAAIEQAESPDEAKKAACNEALAIADEDADACKRIGELGESLIRDKAKVLTHCNAGWLAFVDWGSALSPIYAASRAGKRLFVWVDETRPRCQGMYLTAWELAGEQIEHAIIPDNAAGFYMSRGEVSLVITGSDRIAANGDVANKIGTYEKAVLACENGIPFYIAAPSSTIDWDCKSGKDIPIEERSADEVLSISGIDAEGKTRSVRIAPQGAKARNPAFDVTPAKYITAIITEKGIVKPAEIERLRA